METVLISDANIFIDLHKSDLLPFLFRLPYEIYTTDLVLNEVKSGQATLQLFRQSGDLKVLSATGEELAEMALLKRKNLSLADCSVLYFAKKNGYLLLTNEKNLRKVAKMERVKYHGILYVFELFMENNIIDLPTAISTLNKLLEINKRLPFDIFQQRIDEWRERR